MGLVIQGDDFVKVLDARGDFSAGAFKLVKLQADDRKGLEGLLGAWAGSTVSVHHRVVQPGRKRVRAQ